MKVVVVSNRVAHAQPDEPIAGGLAAALIPMVKESGAIWVGSSGQTSDISAAKRSFRKNRGARRRCTGDGRYAGKHYTAITKASPIRRCGRRCIRAPISSRSRTRIMRLIAKSMRSWRARCCASMIRKRCSGCRIIISSRSARKCAGLASSRPIGFFLHTPWAERHTMAAVPHHAEIVREMLAYDLIGFQTVEDRQNFEDYLARRARHHGGGRHDRHRVGLDAARHLPDRYRRRRIRQAGRQCGDARRCRAAAREPARRQARARRRPAGLFQGTGEPGSCFRPDAGKRAEASNARCRCCKSPCCRAAISRPIAN